MATVRLRGRHTDHLLVPARRVRQVSDPAMARAVARAMARAVARRVLESPGSPGPLGRAHGPPSEDELVRALLSGELVVVEVEGAPRMLDAPRMESLASLAGALDGVVDGVVEPERPGSVTSWIGVRVVDSRGWPLPQFSVRVEDPGGRRHDARLDGGGQARVDGLDEDGGCTITLTPLLDEGR